MDTKNIIIISAVIIVILAVVGFSFFSSDSYKNVDEEFVKNPTANESVRFTGTYFGETSYESTDSISSVKDVLRVGLGNTFVFIDGNFDEFEGQEGNDFTLEGKFCVDNADKQKAVVNGLSVEGYYFYPDSVKHA